MLNFFLSCRRHFYQFHCCFYYRNSCETDINVSCMAKILFIAHTYCTAVSINNYCTSYCTTETVVKLIQMSPAWQKFQQYNIIASLLLKSLIHAWCFGQAKLWYIQFLRPARIKFEKSFYIIILLLFHLMWQSCMCPINLSERHAH